MAETDGEQEARDAGTERERTEADADAAGAPPNIGPNLPRQVERNLEGADTGPAGSDGDSARRPPP
jgi:hypothetical protein